MNGPIDIVIPFLNPMIQSWQNEYKKYANENGYKTQNRFRDWGALKYWFRGVEQNCPWINNVFLIVFDNEQIPEWLNTLNSKLKIIIHKDYIPEEFLPTFNTVTIEMFIHKIPGLSENFIYSNDDMYFLKNISEDMFFKNNKPVSPLQSLRIGKRPLIEGIDYILNNNIECIESIIGTPYNCDHPHFVIPMNKSFMEFIWYKCKKRLLDSFKYSHFRNNYNIGFWLFDDMQRITKHAITNINIFKNSLYFGNSNGNFNKCNNKDIICFNDLDSQKNFEKVKKEFLLFLDKKLPYKSSFEK